MTMLALLTLSFTALLAGLVVGALLNRKAIDRRKDEHAAELFARVETLPTYFHESEIEELPDPARRFFLRNLHQGMPHPSCLRLRLSGTSRDKLATPWTEFGGEEYLVAHPPGRVFFARLRPFPLVWIDRLDTYVGAKAHSQIKLLSSLDTRNAGDDETVRAAMLRYLATLPLLPGAMLTGDDRSWSAHGPDSATFTLRDGAHEVAGVFEFDELGNVLSLTAEDCPSDGARPAGARWVVRYGEHRGFGREGDLQLPTKLELEWQQGEQRVTYVELHVDNLDIDVPHPWTAEIGGHDTKNEP